MCRNAIDFGYNSGHMALWCLEVVPVVYAKGLHVSASDIFKISSADQCFFVDDDLHIQIIEIISPTKHPTSRLYLIIKSFCHKMK